MKNNYISTTQEVISKNSINLNILLEKIPKKVVDFITVNGKVMINIKPVYFDFDKSNIKDLLKKSDIEKDATSSEQSTSIESSILKKIK